MLLNGRKVSIRVHENEHLGNVFSGTITHFDGNMIVLDDKKVFFTTAVEMMELLS